MTRVLYWLETDFGFGIFATAMGSGVILLMLMAYVSRLAEVALLN